MDNSNFFNEPVDAEVVQCHVFVCISFSYTDDHLQQPNNPCKKHFFHFKTRAYRTDEVGSVICLCTRAMCTWLRSLAFVCASSWMSGDVWLIFMADSGTNGGTDVCLKKSPLYSRSRSSSSVRTGCCSPCCSFRLEGQRRSRHGTQNNFHDTKSETPNRARPHEVTINDSRLTDTSGHRHKDHNSLLFEVKHYEYKQI